MACPHLKSQKPHNAARTLSWMIGFWSRCFSAQPYLAWRFGIAPHFTGEPTVTSQIANVVFAGAFGWMYYRHPVRNIADSGAGRQHQLFGIPVAFIDPGARWLSAPSILGIAAAGWRSALASSSSVAFGHR